MNSGFLVGMRGGRLSKDFSTIRNLWYRIKETGYYEGLEKPLHFLPLLYRAV